jgi:hypothetical protein
VAVPRHLDEQEGCEPVREIGAMTDDLNALADWLLALGVDTVARESTGVYWIPLYEVLEQRGLKVWRVDARQMKYVPGRKSDVQDCPCRSTQSTRPSARPASAPAAPAMPAPITATFRALPNAMRTIIQFSDSS